MMMTLLIQSIFTESLDESFASYLYNNSHYNSAITEFYRILFNNRKLEVDEIININYKIAKSYYFIKEYKKSNEVLDNIDKTLISEESRDRITFDYSLNFYFLKEFQRSIFYLDEIRENSKYYYEALLLKSVNYLAIFEINEAEKNLKILQNYNNNFSEFANKSLKLISTSKKIYKKYPVISFFLSFFLPGVGQLYSQQYFDSLQAFLSCAISGSLFGIALYYEIANITGIRTYVLPIISGSLFLFFYVANLYGSIAGAIRANEMVKVKLLKNIAKLLDTINFDDKSIILSIKKEF